MVLPVQPKEDAEQERSFGEILAPFRAERRKFRRGSLDGQAITGAKYDNCEFADLSFKDCTLSGGSFDGCIFSRCYFRGAKLAKSSFVGCRFVDCRFPHIDIQSCDFRYASFKDCIPPYAQMATYNLPQEPNLREDLARNLAIEASRLGLAEEARQYRKEEIRAREKHLWAAVVAESKWYREHFGIGRRILSFFSLVASWLNRYLSGYGDSFYIPLRNWVLSVALCSLLFMLLKSGIRPSPEAVTWESTALLSIMNSTRSAITCGITPMSLGVRLISIMQSVYSVVTFALLTSYIVRWSLRR